MGQVKSYDWAGNEIIEEIPDQIIELRNSFDKMFSVFKEIIMMVQKDKEIYDAQNKGITGSFNNILTFGNVNTQTISLSENEAEAMNIQRSTPLVTRPIQFGNSMIRLGTLHEAIHFYDENGRAIHHPYSMDEEKEILDILKEKINSSDDLVDFNMILLEMQNILPKFIAKQEISYERQF